ncbi:hypothetical protein JMJ77_0007681, partial [Colletotrichum scovillei]
TISTCLYNTSHNSILIQLRVSDVLAVERHLSCCPPESSPILSKLPSVMRRHAVSGLRRWDGPGSISIWHQTLTSSCSPCVFPQTLAWDDNFLTL